MHRFPTLTDELARRINRIGAEIAISQYGSSDNVGRFGGDSRFASRGGSVLRSRRWFGFRLLLFA